ncbi:MAG TPA: plastocyanin/azurin family copper-binding protein [Methanoregula sp.]|nr:plastocyanin/azurin family copper-binding protein [Methanoregula sp.]
MKTVIPVLVLVFLLLAAAGCTQTRPPAVSPPVTTPAGHPVATTQRVPSTQPTLFVVGTPTTGSSVSDNTVTIHDLAFDPPVISVRAGDTVRWVNEDEATHNIRFVSPGFSTFLLSTGQSFSQKFARPGTYDYTCAIHPFMHGTVQVV